MYSSDTPICFNIPVLKLINVDKNPQKIPPKIIKYLSLLDCNIYLNECFKSFIYVVNLIFSFASTFFISLNLIDNIAEIMQNAKHNINGIYPLITNKKPETSVVIASM